MQQELIETILAFAGEASGIALTEQANLSATEKADASYVTQVDLRLSELAFTRLSKVVPESSIVSEENLQNLSSLRADYPGTDDEITLFIDPIDGTRNYFHNMPLFGVSIGVFRNREPWMGVVVFPALDELFCFDGRKATITTGAFRGNAERRPLVLDAHVLDMNSVMLFANSFVRHYQWRYDVCTSLVTACVALNSCWPLVRRGVGTILNDHIWDFAGAWPILQSVGFELRGLDSERLFTKYHYKDYDDDTHLLKEPVVVSRPEHFRSIKAGIIPGGWA
ncbi:MAG: inositol monophosphatase family protein [Alkalispirochaeta sp.]